MSTGLLGLGALVFCAATSMAGSSGPGTVVYGLHAPGSPDGFFTISPDGSGNRRLPLATGGCTDCIAVSADGKRILFQAQTTDKRVGVATANLDGTNHRVLRLPGGKLNLGPGAWSPDAKRIAFEGWDPSGARNGLYTGDSRVGGDIQRVTDSGPRRHDVPLLYSPDGARILLFRMGLSGDLGLPGNLLVVKPNGSGLRRLNPAGTNVRAAFGSPASWSADGRTIAFAAFSSTDTENGRSAIFTIDRRGEHVRRITPWQQWTTSARWSPDGHWIAFDKLRSDIPAHDLFVMRPDGTSVKDILAATPGLGSCCAVWSPDSRRLLFQRGDQRLWTVAVTGSDPELLTKTAGEYWYAWAR